MSLRLTPLVLLACATFAALLLTGANCNGGNACQSDDDCSGAFVCGDDDGIDGGAQVCLRPCTGDARCPNGFACTPQEDRALCLEATGNAALGEACTADRDCQDGVCDDRNNVCVAGCSATEPCTGGLLCALEGPRRLCVEADDTRGEGEVCASARQCESGICALREGDDAPQCRQSCAQGACDDGDVCLNLAQGGGAVCAVALDDGARCQDEDECQNGRCIDDVDGVSKCAGPCAPDGSCAAGFLCVPDDVGGEVCMPLLDDRQAGEACATGRDCASGKCAEFDAGTVNFGFLCADPCLEGACDVDLVCWTADDGVDLCGPTP
jgi:hypothetical protein